MWGLRGGVWWRRVLFKSGLPLPVAEPPLAGVPLQVASPGPKTLKLIVPVGLVPPARVAVSEIVPPAVAPVALVVTVGEAAITVLVSRSAVQTALLQSHLTFVCWLLVQR